jgi:type II secretory pathway pseudopilin PulG
MRQAFSMVTAIFVMVILATISVLVLNTAGQISQNTVLQYRQEQAALLAKGYTEFAILSVLKHDKNSTNSCVEDINGTVGDNYDEGSGYLAEVKIYYIGNNLTGCGTKLNDTNITQPGGVVGAYAPHVLIDTFIKYKDPINTNEVITYHRRSLQKI